MEENADVAMNDILNAGVDSGVFTFNIFDIVQDLQRNGDASDEDDACDDDAYYLDLLAGIAETSSVDLAFMNEIRKLCIDFIHTIPHTFINKLLAVLKAKTKLPFSKDSRTFLKAPRKSTVHIIGKGEYCHYEVKNAVTGFLMDKKKVESDTIKLIVNIAGATFANSS